MHSIFINSFFSLCCLFSFCIPANLTLTVVWSMSGPFRPYEHFICFLWFLRVEAICLSLGARAAIAKSCMFNKKWRKLCINDIIWPRKCWPKVTKFAPERFLLRAYPLPKVGVFTTSGSRDSRWDQYYMLPSPWRVILRLSPVLALKYGH